MSFKNIRIPKRGGGTRLQRVKVLKSGKYKFVKNPSKSRAKRPKTKKKRKRRVRYTVARRKKRRGGKSLQQTAFKWIRVGALVAPAVEVAVKRISAEAKFREGIRRYTGFNMYRGTMDWGALLLGYGPLLGATVATYGIPKLAGIIRRAF